VLKSKPRKKQAAADLFAFDLLLPWLTFNYEDGGSIFLGNYD
jgi:hypothetical protein